MKFPKRALFVFLAYFLHHSLLAQSYFKEEYQDVWLRATNYTLEVAEAMPAEKYGFRPTEESMTFHEQISHLVQNLSFLSDQITGERPDFFEGKAPEGLAKEEICRLLGKAFLHVSQLIKEVDDSTLRQSIEFGGEKMPKENIFYLMRDHATHHRAQAILYLRMNGIEAPRYRGW